MASQRIKNYLALADVKSARSKMWSSTFQGVRGCYEDGFGWRNFGDTNNPGGYCQGMSLLWLHYMHRQWGPVSGVPSAWFSRTYKGTLRAQAIRFFSQQAKMQGGPGDRTQWIQQRISNGRDEVGAVMGITYGAPPSSHATAIYARRSYVYLYDSNFIMYAFDREQFTLARHVQTYFDTVYNTQSFEVTKVFSDQWGWPE